MEKESIPNTKESFTDVELERLLNTIMMKYGFDDLVAARTAKILVETEKRGHSSHGIVQFPIIIDKVLSKRITCNGEIEILSDSDNIAVVDGMNGIGYHNGYVAMTKCIQKAKKHGLGMVTVRNSSHFGSGGFYSNLAVSEGLIGITMSNTRPLVSSHILSNSIIGTNPISVGFPLSNGEDSKFLVDMSTSVTSFNKIKEYANRNEQIPIGWGIDSDLLPTTDPNKVLDNGALLPLGSGDISSGYKGFYIALIVEMFCSLLSGGKTSIEMKRESTNSSHAFIVLDPEFFVGREAFIQHANHVFTLLQDHVQGIYIPGSIKISKDYIYLPNELTSKLYNMINDTN